MSHYYAHQHQQPRPRPEPLALGGQQHAPPALDQHRARLLSSLRSAPLPHQDHHHQRNHNQNQYHAQQQYPQPQQQQHSHNPAFPAHHQAAAAAEFQHAQSAYLAELAGLQRTIEQQIVAQQQLERDAAYRLLAAQRQQGPSPAQVQSAAQFANYAPAPHQQQQQQQQGPYSAGPHNGRGFVQQQQQQFAPAPSSGPAISGAHHEAQNPLVASALARRQRQEQAQHVGQQQQRSRAGSSSPHGRAPAPRVGQQAHSQPQSRSASREQHRSTPPLYGQQQQQQQRASPPPPALVLSAPGEPYPDTSSGSESGETRPSSPDATLDAVKHQQQQGVKASRRRSHLDALVGLGHAVEQRKGGAGVAVAVASRARPASSSFASPPPPPQGEFYAGQFVVPGPAHGHGHGHRSVSDSHAVLSPHASTYAPSPSPAATTTIPRYAPPPVPGTAYAVRQPRIPPTDLTAETNFAARVRARAIESLRARGGRAAVAGAVEGVLVPSLATVQIRA
ncbi:hypothetical protein JCM8208_004482 [Rhodotorula glutinis]